MYSLKFKHNHIRKDGIFMPIYKTGKKNKDGVTQYRVTYNYTDNAGKYRQKTKLVYGSIAAKTAEIQLQLQSNTSSINEKITLKQLFDEYIESKKDEVRLTSLEKIKSVLSREVVPMFANTSIAKLSSADLQKWKNSISDRNLSISTKKNIYGEFRALLNYSVKMEYIPKNPLLKIGNFKEVYFEKPQDKIHYYTPEQFKKFIAIAKEDKNFCYYVFFNIAYYTGMRKGEINALKWSDIEGNTIHVRRSIAQKVKGQSIVETPPKNKTSYRDIQIPNSLLEILQTQKELQSKENRFSDDFRICGGISCISDTTLSNKNIEFSKKAGLETIRIHDFRHSHASLLVNNGINIQEVARRLGHAKIEITWNTYSHLYPNKQSEVAETLADYVIQ